MKYSFSTITRTGLLVGTLDITAACLQYFIKTGKGPAGVLKYVASGVFGNAAFAAGNSMICWGLLFHYIIAMAFTFFFFSIFPILQSITSNRIVTGIVYGIFTWAVTTQIIVRLSNTPKPKSFDVTAALIASSILIVCIGIPLAYIAGRASKNTSV